MWKREWRCNRDFLPEERHARPIQPWHSKVGGCRWEPITQQWECQYAWVGLGDDFVPKESGKELDSCQEERASLNRRGGVAGGGPVVMENRRVVDVGVGEMAVNGWLVGACGRMSSRWWRWCYNHGGRLWKESGEEREIQSVNQMTVPGKDGQGSWGICGLIDACAINSFLVWLTWWKTVGFDLSTPSVHLETPTCHVGLNGRVAEPEWTQCT